jgi:hypothetical protein
MVKYICEAFLKLSSFERKSIRRNLTSYPCIRPYHVENTSSRPITEVKQHWAALVLGWVTAWEYAVLYSFCVSHSKHHSNSIQ